MTEKLFYDDPYVTEFEARIVRIDTSGDRLRIQLDRTCFYPEGGGQPADKGTIDGYPVVDVQKEDDEIIHFIEKGASAVAPDAIVHGAVDWSHRHDYMQQHTGQHLISAALLSVGEYNTVSVHQGDEYTTVEVDKVDMDSSDIAETEELANRIICANYPVTDHWVTDAEIHNYPLRRPPKVSGKIRLVMIKDFDCVACGGVHTRSTGEVGLVKCIGVERVRGRVRTVWKIGDRAHADYRLKHEIVTTLGQELSVQPANLLERVRQLSAQLGDARREMASYRSRVARAIADELYAAAAHRKSGIRIVAHRFEQEDKELFRSIVEELASRQSSLFCIVNVIPDQLQWAVGHGTGSETELPEGASDASLDFSMVRGELLPLINGKGGGKPPIWQGVGQDGPGTSEFLAQFVKRI